MVSEPQNQLIQAVLKKHQEPLKKWPWIIISIFIFGVILSIYSDDWNWFSRSGSLVVVCGLFIAKWDLSRRVDEENLDFLDPVIIEVNKEKGGSAASLKMDDVKDALHSMMTEYNNPRYILWEFYIIGLGTLVWGFGDLIGVVIEYFYNIT
jgi:hypothetical protein